MKRTVATILLLSFAVVALSAVDATKAMYVGGTVQTIKEKKQGKLDVQQPEQLTFTPDDKKLGSYGIAWSAIKELEYGQKAGRRVAVGLLVSPLALFSKKRNHYLTISYTDTAGADQAVVFELGKEIIRTHIKVIETRSGKKVQYQDEEARKAGVGGS